MQRRRGRRRGRGDGDGDVGEHGSTRHESELAAPLFPDQLCQHTYTHTYIYTHTHGQPQQRALSTVTARVRSRACTGQSGFHVYIRNFERSALQLPGRGVVREFVEEITGGRGRRRNEEDRQDRIGKDRRGIASKYISSRERISG